MSCALVHLKFNIFIILCLHAIIASFLNILIDNFNFIEIRGLATITTVVVAAAVAAALGSAVTMPTTTSEQPREVASPVS